jgi:hypothetical protein
LASATLGAFGGSKRHLIKGRDIMNATLARDSDRAVELVARHFTATARVPDQEQCRDDANDAGQFAFERTCHSFRNQLSRVAIKLSSCWRGGTHPPLEVPDMLNKAFYHGT